MNALPTRKHAVNRQRGAMEDCPAVFQNTPLKAELHRTLHEAEKSVEQIAFECRISPSYLYRSCLTGDAGCRFPLDLLLPFMAATSSHRILDYLNGACDRATVKLPRVRQIKRAEIQAVNEITGRFHAAMSAVHEYFAAPEQSKAAAVEAGLRQHLNEVVALMRAMANFHQGDLL